MKLLRLGLWESDLLVDKDWSRTSQEMLSGRLDVLGENLGFLIGSELVQESRTPFIRCSQRV